MSKFCLLSTFFEVIVVYIYRKQLFSPPCSFDNLLDNLVFLDTLCIDSVSSLSFSLKVLVKSEKIQRTNKIFEGRTAKLCSCNVLHILSVFALLFTAAFAELSADINWTHLFTHHQFTAGRWDTWSAVMDILRYIIYFGCPASEFLFENK